MPLHKRIVRPWLCLQRRPYKNTPYAVTGKREKEKFEPITWDEAYKEIAEKLNHIKATDGPQAVAFFGGYNKWFRPCCAVLPIPLEL